MKRISFLAAVIIAALLAIAVFCETETVKGGDRELGQQIYDYMKKESNQAAVFNDAIALNGNKSSNACVYFVSEVLRKNDISVSKYTANTSQLISALQSKGWEKEFNYKDLMPGDIVFTTDGSGNKNGVPTHTYVFMKWVREGSYDYAYICDNQAKDYENKTYHIRNIAKRDKVDGKSKDAFSFFMRIP